MNEIPLSFAAHLGINEINRRGTTFKPNISWLLTDLMMSPGTSGVIALPTKDGFNSHDKGYDLVTLSAPEVPSLDITVDDLWACAKEHYGLTATAVAAGAGGIPIKKLRLGYPRALGSSEYTNLVRHYGLKFFPKAILPHRSIAARVAKSTFGTIRIFGIIGRATPFAAVGLAVYDVISIGLCAYEERHGK